MNDSFVNQFAPNIKFNSSCFDRVILRGDILRLFYTSGVVLLLRALGFNSLSNGIMRLLLNLERLSQILTELKFERRSKTRG